MKAILGQPVGGADDADGADGTGAVIEHCRCDGAHVVVLLADGDRITARLHEVERVAEVTAVHDGRVGEGFEVVVRDEGSTLRLAKVRGHRLAEGGGVDGRARADAVGKTHVSRDLALVDVENTAPSSLPSRTASPVAAARRTSSGSAAPRRSNWSHTLWASWNGRAPSA